MTFLYADEENRPGHPSGDPSTEHVDRRGFLTAGSSLAMAGGMLAGYGTLGYMAVRYLYPAGTDTAWMLVRDLRSFPPGESISFESPTGVRVSVTRRVAAGAAESPQELAAEATVEEFIALSNVCPHLGCRVHWELNNKRFFCPCHNGAFDPEGKPTAGPPLQAGQELPRYPLKIENGLLFIEMPTRSVVQPTRGHGESSLSV